MLPLQLMPAQPQFPLFHHQAPTGSSVAPIFLPMAACGPVAPQDASVLSQQYSCLHGGVLPMGGAIGGQTSLQPCSLVPQPSLATAMPLYLSCSQFLPPQPHPHQQVRSFPPLASQPQAPTVRFPMPQAPLGATTPFTSLNSAGPATGLTRFAFLAPPPSMGPLFMDTPPLPLASSTTTVGGPNLTSVTTALAALPQAFPSVSIPTTTRPMSSNSGGTSGSGGGAFHHSPSSDSSSANPWGLISTPVSSASSPHSVAAAVPAKRVVTKSLCHSKNGIGLEMGGTYRGVIKRYNPSRGFGFIQSDHGVDIFFHSSGICSSANPDDFDVGQRVEFRVSPDLDHVQAVEVRTACPP